MELNTQYVKEKDNELWFKVSTIYNEETKSYYSPNGDRIVWVQPYDEKLIYTDKKALFCRNPYEYTPTGKICKDPISSFWRTAVNLWETETESNLRKLIQEKYPQITQKINFAYPSSG